MAHPRKLIRQKVVELLTGKTVAQDRVYGERIDPINSKHKLPAITVSIPDDAVSSDSTNISPRELEREPTIQIEGWLARVANIDDEMDDLAEEIEAVMHDDPYLAGTVGRQGIYQEDTETQVILHAGRTLGLVTLTYGGAYYQSVPEPPADADLDDFRRAHADYNLGGDTHEDDQATDDFPVHEDEQ